MADLTRDDVRALLTRVAGGAVAPLTNVPAPEGAPSSNGSHARYSSAPIGGGVVLDWHGLRVVGDARGTNIGKMVLALSTDLARVAHIAETVPLARMLEHTASNATVRVVVHEGDMVALESVVVCDEIDPARAEEIVRLRLAELFTVASAWRARLGLAMPGIRATPAGPQSRPVPGAPAPPPAPLRPSTIAELKREVRLPSDHALLVAAVAFGVAGADGEISPAESGKLRAWLSDVPAFAGLDLSRVVRAIALLVEDPARALMESARRLDARARLLAWALANDMAHADGYASEDERRYLANVASVFKLDPELLAPLAAEAQGNALRRETVEPGPPR